MNTLILPSLDIDNFRLFRHLHIEHLARVNLIVGKNNVGKTSLLEAIWLYARRGDPGVIWEQLAMRDESAPVGQRSFHEPFPALDAIRHLFFQRPGVLTAGGHLTIGSDAHPDTRLMLGIEHHPDRADQQRGHRPFFVLRIGGTTQLDTALTHGLFDVPYLPSEPPIPHTMVAAQGLTATSITALWDRIALTDREDHVVTALRIIAPEIERVNMITDEAIGPQRIAMVRVTGSDQPVSLRSYGDGMSRLFVLAVAAVNARDGVVLIDEIENGMHYTVQPAIWRHIFQLAAALNIQVFATTHSWDCIEAFEIAAADDHATGQIIKLGRTKDGAIGATLFDEGALALMSRDHIEVR